MTQRKMKITDFASFRYPTNLAMSPDGKYGVFAVSQKKLGDSLIFGENGAVARAFIALLDKIDALEAEVEQLKEGQA